MNVEKNDARYVVDGNESPIVIRNDNGVKLYVELKKTLSEFIMYSLCKTMMDKCSVDIEFNGKMGVVVCVEGIPLYVPGFEIGNVICDSKNVEVKVKQLYKNKSTLVSVMTKYALTNDFNFRAKRLAKISIVANTFKYYN